MAGPEGWQDHIGTTALVVVVNLGIALVALTKFSLVWIITLLVLTIASATFLANARSATDEPTASKRLTASLAALGLAFVVTLVAVLSGAAHDGDKAGTTTTTRHGKKPPTTTSTGPTTTSGSDPTTTTTHTRPPTTSTTTRPPPPPPSGGPVIANLTATCTGVIAAGNTITMHYAIDATVAGRAGYGAALYDEVADDHYKGENNNDSFEVPAGRFEFDQFVVIPDDLPKGVYEVEGEIWPENHVGENGFNSYRESTCGTMTV